MKLTMGFQSIIQVSLVVSTIGVLTLCLSWIPVIILYSTGIEANLWSSIPWDNLLLVVGISLSYNFLLTLGIAVTYPIFTSLGALFGIPLNSIIDAIARNLAFTEAKIFGTILLIIGFAILLIPTKKAQIISKKLINYVSCKRS